MEIVNPLPLIFFPIEMIRPVLSCSPAIERLRRKDCACVSERETTAFGRWRHALPLSVALCLWFQQSARVGAWMSVCLCVCVAFRWVFKCRCSPSSSSSSSVCVCSRACVCALSNIVTLVCAASVCLQLSHSDREGTKESDRWWEREPKQMFGENRGGREEMEKWLVEWEKVWRQRTGDEKEDRKGRN